jgi:osmotically-inducible protein OsmY
MGTQGSGRFAGRGPKGWQRSDDRIRDDINERLTRHPDVDATEIDVQVSNGQVTLSGTVDERHARRLAEDIAEGVSGVKEVQNHIRVQQGLISAGHSTPELTAGSGRNMGPQSGRK